MELSREEQQGLYLKMLTVELDAGVKVPREQLHTSRAIIECRQQSAVANCMYRVRLAGDATSAAQPLPASLTARALDYAHSNRPELADETVLVSDLICDYIGKKSPPYNVEDVHCFTQYPRAVNEAIFDGKAAEDLAESMRGETAYGKQVVTLNGALICQWVASSGRTLCATRSNIAGVLQDKVIELNAGTAATLAHSLRQTLLDREQSQNTLTASENKKNSVPMPTEIVSSLTCVVDNTQIETSGNRTYSCRARI